MNQKFKWEIHQVLSLSKIKRKIKARRKLLRCFKKLSCHSLLNVEVVIYTSAGGVIKGQLPSSGTYVSPTKRAGEVCASDMECFAKECVNKKCSLRCDREVDCQDGYHCNRKGVKVHDYGKCEPKKEQGETCYTPDTCKSYNCALEKCRGPKQGEDGPCKDKWDCTSYVCINNKCFQGVKYGQPCKSTPKSFKEICEEATYCYKGICRSKTDISTVEPNAEKWFVPIDQWSKFTPTHMKWSRLVL